MAKKVFIACDHGGFLLKGAVADVVAELGFEVVDLGCYDGGVSVDYNDYAATLARHIQRENIAAFAAADGDFCADFADGGRESGGGDFSSGASSCAGASNSNLAQNQGKNSADLSLNSNLNANLTAGACGEKFLGENGAKFLGSGGDLSSNLNLNANLTAGACGEPNSNLTADAGAGISAGICAQIPPELARKIAASEPAAFGVLLCGTGLGMSIAANRAPLVRAALCHDQTTARLAREHNNANVLCLGARVVGETLARDIVASFFGAGFAGGRHARRVCKLG